MTLEQVLEVIDGLSADELETVYQHVAQRRRPAYWLVPSEWLQEIKTIMAPVHAEAESMTEEEINAVIDEALAEVRRERREAIDRGD